MDKVKLEKQLKGMISEASTETKKLSETAFSNNLDKIFEEAKIGAKIEIYEQALVNVGKADSINTFLLHEIDVAEKEIENCTNKRKEVRTKISNGDSVDQKENGEINGKIIAWNEIMSMCMDSTSESAREDYRSRNKA